MTPTSGLYSDLENSLFIEGVKLFSLFAAYLGWSGCSHDISN